MVCTWLLKLLRRTGWQRIPFVKFIYNGLLAHLKPDSIFIDEILIYLDKTDSLRLSIYGEWEFFETSLFKKHIKKGDVVFDIGAHIGYYTLVGAKAAGSDGMVYSFEPHPDNCRALKRSIKQNGFTNIIVIQKAVSDHSGITQLFISKDTSAAHHLYNSSHLKQSIDVDVTSLDILFLKKSIEVNVIKMDIEGAEVRALRGMRNLLQRSKRITLFSEFWPLGLQRCGSNPREYLHILTDLGFVIYVIDEVRREIKPIIIGDLLKIYTPEKGNHTNLMCVKERG